jgi:hypothetical protein
VRELAHFEPQKYNINKSSKEEKKGFFLPIDEGLLKNQDIKEGPNHCKYFFSLFLCGNIVRINY